MWQTKHKQLMSEVFCDWMDYFLQLCCGELNTISHRTRFTYRVFSMWDQLSIYIFTQHGFIPRSILKLSHSALLIRHVRVLICNRQVLWPVFHLWIFKAGVAHELQLFIFTWPSIFVHCLQRDDRLMEMRLDSFYVLLSLKLMSDFLDVNPNVIHLCDTHANHSFYQVVFDWFCYWVTSELRLGFIWLWDFFLSFFSFHSQTGNYL